MAHEQAVGPPLSRAGSASSAGSVLAAPKKGPSGSRRSSRSKGLSGLDKTLLFLSSFGTGIPAGQILAQIQQGRLTEEQVNALRREAESDAELKQFIDDNLPALTAGVSTDPLAGTVPGSVPGAATEQALPPDTQALPGGQAGSLDAFVGGDPSAGSPGATLGQKKLSDQQFENPANREAVLATEEIQAKAVEDEILNGATSLNKTAEFALRFPDAFESFSKNSGLITDTQKKQAGNFGFQVEHATPGPQLDQLFNRRIQNLRSQGRNTDATVRASQLDPEEQKKWARIAQISVMSNEDRLAQTTTAKPLQNIIEGENLTQIRRDPITGEDITVGSGPRSVSDGTSVRDKQIEDATSEFGLSRAEAVKLVDGHARIETDDFGRARYVDNVTGEVREITIQPAPPTEPLRDVVDVPKKDTLFALAEFATGPIATTAAGLSVPSSAVGGPVAEEAVEARQQFATTTQQLIRALSINPRFPVAEMKRITEEIKVQPSFLVGPGLLQARMRAVDKSLTVRSEQARRDQNDTNLSEETRRNAGSAARAIENYLDVLGVPIELPKKFRDAGFTEATWGVLTRTEQLTLMRES